MTTTAVATPTRSTVAIQQPQPAKPLDRIKQEIQLRVPMISDLLPKHLPVQKFVADLIMVVGSNPDLQKCDMRTLIKACLEAAEVGLSLNPALKEADIIAYGTTAQFQPRYVGLMKLARQGGEVRSIEARIVREGDEFDYAFGMDKFLNHKPSKERGASRKPITHAYCIWEDKYQSKDFDVMTLEEIEDVRKRSRSPNKGPWVTDLAPMAKKSVVRRASNYMPRSTEFANAIAVDTAAELGKQYHFESGSVIVDDDTAPVDITDTAPQPTAQAAAQVDAVANRVAGATAAAPTVQKIEATDGDWAGWSQRAVAAVRALKTRTEAKAWRAAHQQEYDDLEFNDAEAHAGLREALNAVGKAA